ncbi:MAG: DUF4287 domain-containing protein [Roseiflexaceae bacterium]|nr:DUF4287 domain-containing protein [Roseiflexaceae bacterium]
MSFQAYLDSVKAQTGKTPDDFRQLSAEKGLVKNGEIVAWLKSEFALGHGHANAIAHVIMQHGKEPVSNDDAIAAHFAGNKAEWRKSYDALVAEITTFGADSEVAPTKTYISLLRGSKKFAILQITADRMDIGIKLKGVAATERLEAAGSWNAMVTHRVRITEPGQIDNQVFAWLKQAYAAA